MPNTTFLESVARQLLETHGTAMHQLAVVFPNRRQAAYIEKYLREHADGPMFLPEMLTIEQLVAATGTLQPADNLVQGFYLYRAFTEVYQAAGEAPQDIPDLERFFSIGETLIRDFREMDAYCTDVDRVCTILYETEQIDKAFNQLTEEQLGYLQGFWKGVRQKGAIQEKFLRLWLRLPAIYHRFHALLQADGYTTLGMAYRRLAQDESLDSGLKQQWQHLAFVGFNALNRAEEMVLLRWQQAGFASLYMDTDHWYLNDERQEAGDFLRRNLQRLGLKNKMPAGHAIAGRTTPIKLVAAEGNMAQAKTLQAWWQQLRQAGVSGSVGILLADENLLIPVLQSLPEDMPVVNVTMGYPMQQSMVYDLVKLMLDMQEDLAAHRHTTLHHALATRWLQHPLCNLAATARKKIQQQMLDEHLLRVPVQRLRKDATDGLLFDALMHPAEIFDRLTDLCAYAHGISSRRNDNLTAGLLVAMHQALQQLRLVFRRFFPDAGYGFLRSILLRQLGGLSVPFQGEPLQDIQVMGLLESRGLDFDHILLLGAGEGNLPRIKAPDSFIPHQVRKAFGMTIPEHQDAIFAYVFYRLLHRNQTFTVVYNSLVGDNSTGEITRFIQQLQYESPIPFETEARSLQVVTAPRPPIVVQKDEKVRARLSLYLGAKPTIGLSPSAINSYLGCRLQFYFKYIARLKKPDQLQDGVESHRVGSVVHKLMEILYHRHLTAHGAMVTEADIDRMAEQITDLLPDAFQQAWYQKPGSKPPDMEGEMLVVEQVVDAFARLFLAFDRRHTPFHIRHLELSLDFPFGFRVNGAARQVMIKGYADRVDEVQGVMRMLDYKTGSDDPAFKQVSALFERDGKAGNKAALQTLLYTWLYSRRYRPTGGYEPSLVVARKLAKDGGRYSGHLRQKKGRNQQVAVTADHIETYLEEMAAELATLLGELFDDHTPFDQTTDSSHCTYCDFAGICGRG